VAWLRASRLPTDPLVLVLVLCGFAWRILCLRRCCCRWRRSLCLSCRASPRGAGGVRACQGHRGGRGEPSRAIGKAGGSLSLPGP